MAKMKTSKYLNQFANHLVFNYAKFDTLSDSYTISVNSIPDFDLHELAALIMSEDSDLAAEANGPDNKWYEFLMLPALLKHMQNSTDPELKRDFEIAWKQGILNYLERSMQELLNEICEDHFYNVKTEAGLIPMRRKDNNELYWRQGA
jgi:hypothetical protein